MKNQFRHLSKEENNEFLRLLQKSKELFDGELGITTSWNWTNLVDIRLLWL